MLNSPPWTTIVSAMHDMIIVAEYPSLRICFSNAATHNILSYSQEQIQQLSLPDLFPPSYGPQLRGTLDALIHRAPVREQESMQTRDGTPLLVDTQYSLIQPGEHSPLYILCAAREAALHPIREQLQNRMEFLNHAVIDAAPIGIFSYDRQGRVTLINRTQLRINRIPDDAPIEQFVGMPILDQNSTIRANGLLEPLQQVLEGHTFDLEILRFVTRNRQEISVQVQGVPLRNDRGTIVGGLVMVQDISARVDYQQRLQQSEARYRWLVKALPDLLLRIDDHGRFIDVEAAKVKLYAEPKQFLGRTMGEIMPLDLAQRAETVLQHAFATKTEQSLEYQLPLNGEVRDFEARLTPIDAHEALVVIRDITEHTRAARAVIESEKRFRALAEALPDLVFHLDHQGTYLDFRVPPDSGFFEPAREDIIGKKISEVIPADAASAALPAFYEAVHTGKMTGAEYTIREPGGVRHYECRFSPTANQEIIAVVRDVTERKKQEHLLQRIAGATQRLLAADDLDSQAVDGALGLLGDTLSATCVFLFEGSHLASQETPLLTLRGQWIDTRSTGNGVAEASHVTDGDSRPWPASIAPWHKMLTDGMVVREALTLSPDDDLALLTGCDHLSILIVPVFADSTWWGMLLFADSQSSRQWTTGDESALNTMAASIGGVIRRNHIEADLRRARRNADILREAGQAITSTLHLPEIFARLLDQIRRIIELDTANVMLFDQDQPRLIAAYGYDQLGIEEAAIASLAQPMLQFPLIQRILATKTPVICTNVPNDPDWVGATLTHWVKSWIGVPIVLRDDVVVGIFSLESSHVGTYDQPDLLLPIVTGIAKQAAIAVENVRYYEQIQRRNNELLTLQKAGRAVLSDLKLDEMLLRLAQEMARIAGVSWVIICRSDSDARTGVVETSYPVAGLYPHTTEFAPRATIDVTHPHLQTAFQQNRSLVLTSDILPSVFAGVPELAGAQWLVVVPLRSNDQNRGFVLLCNYHSGQDPQPEQITVCEALADQVTMMLDQARLFEDIRSLERIKSHMINMASHDLRGPLTRIGNALRTLDQEPAALSGEQKEAIATAWRAVNDMDAMMRKLLSLKRIEERHRKAETIVWSEIISASAASQDAELIAKNQVLRLDIAPDLPTTLGDPVQLTRALANLIQNAIKFTPPYKEITIRGFLKDYGGKPVIAVEVKDTGDGIPPALQGDLFTPFYRAQHEDSPDVPGTGLGLWIVKATIEEHRGRVYFDSVPKQGSMFGFWVPVD